MAKYIDADLINYEQIESWGNDGNTMRCDFEKVAYKNKIDAIPAADVRPVVLCRDCKHNKGARVWRFLDLDDVTADCSAGHGYPPMDWFYTDGEKREKS